MSVFRYKTSKLNNRDVNYTSVQAKNRYRGSSPLMEYNHNKIPNNQTPENGCNEYSRISINSYKVRPKLRCHVLKINGKTNSFMTWRDVNENKNVTVTWDVKLDEAEEIMNDVGVSHLKFEDNNEEEWENETFLGPYPISRLAQESETFEPESNTDLPSVSNVNYCVKYRGLGEDLILHRRKRGSNPRGINYTAGISDEVILSIFSFLPRKDLATCARVCKRWKTIVYDESLWKNIDLKKKYLQAEMVGYVIERKVKVLRLALAKVELPIFSPNLDFENIECKLEYLDLSLCSVTVKGIEHILVYCANLKKLSLENCELSDLACLSIGNNKDLEVLNLCMCSGINATGLLHIATNCKKIRSLNLSWAGLCSYSFDLLSVHLTSAIQHLNIAGARETLKDAHIAMLGDLCPNLRELDISDGLRLTISAIDIIISKLVLLEHLHASNCYSISPVKYLELRQLQYLKKLELFGLFNEEALQSLRQSLPHLEINKQIFSTIARPCTGRSWKMWGIYFKQPA